MEESRFRVSLDSGPLFKPTHVRMEGDDPIAVAVLIDATRPKRDLLPPAADAVAALAEGLHSDDRVSVYAMDCALIREVRAVSPDAAKLRAAVARALQPWRDRGGSKQKEKDACKPALPLWDSMLFVTRELYRERGRRVMIVVSDGEDAGSQTKWNAVLLAAQESSTAVFGVLTEFDLGIGPAVGRMGQNAMIGGSPVGLVKIPARPGFEDPFNAICELSGGVEISAGKKDLGVQFQRAMQMVRSRYIVEYPRGNNDKPGVHTINVRIAKMDAYIRPAGLTVPVADQKVLADPTTLPTDQSGAPVFGTRKPLGPPSN